MFTISWLGAIIIVISCFGKTDIPGCDMYKKGKFYFYNKVTRQKIDIERRDSLQIEINSKTGDITVMKVSWKGECEYELLFNYITPKEVSKSIRPQTVIEISADIPLRIKILSGTDSYYVFEAKKEGFKTLRDTVWLVKEFTSAFTK